MSNVDRIVALYKQAAFPPGGHFPSEEEPLYEGWSPAFQRHLRSFYQLTQDTFKSAHEEDIDTVLKQNADAMYELHLAFKSVDKANDVAQICAKAYRTMMAYLLPTTDNAPRACAKFLKTAPVLKDLVSYAQQQGEGFAQVVDTLNRLLDGWIYAYRALGAKDVVMALIKVEQTLAEYNFLYTHPQLDTSV